MPALVIRWTIEFNHNLNKACSVILLEQLHWVPLEPVILCSSSPTAEGIYCC
eukprot:COSAG06_NODE_2181_length_7402_cov_8.928933_1_plen_51_part_10